MKVVRSHGYHPSGQRCYGAAAGAHQRVCPGIIRMSAWNALADQFHPKLLRGDIERAHSTLVSDAAQRALVDDLLDALKRQSELCRD